MEGSTAAVAVPARRRGDVWARVLASPWVLLAPAIIALTAVATYPLLYGIRASFHTYRYGRDLGSAGLENYRVVFHDHVFWTALRARARCAGFGAGLEAVLGLGLARLVLSELRSSRFLRVGLILPMTIAPVVV